MNTILFPGYVFQMCCSLCLPDMLELDTDITLSMLVTFCFVSSSDFQHLTSTVTVSPAGMQLTSEHVLLHSEVVQDFFITFMSIISLNIFYS